MTNDERSPKLETRSLRHSDFGFRISCFFRHSSFVIRHFSLTHYQLRWLFLLIDGPVRPERRELPAFLAAVHQSAAAGLARLAAADAGAGHRRGESEQLADSIVLDQSRFDQRLGFPVAVGEHRLRAAAAIPPAGGHQLVGPELDLGSNDELFWFWVKRSQPPAIYYCRHDQFAASQARQMTPFEPRWLIEALGVVEFDRSLPHQLTVLPNDRLRIDTIRNTPEGPMTKITILDGSQGWILEQHLYDARRRLVARSIASGHRQDPLSGLVMPTVVQIDSPAGETIAADRPGQRRDQPSVGRSDGALVDAEHSRHAGGRHRRSELPVPDAANGRHHPSSRNARQPAACGVVTPRRSPSATSRHVPSRGFRHTVLSHIGRGSHFSRESQPRTGKNVVLGTWYTDWIRPRLHFPPFGTLLWKRLCLLSVR